MVLLAGESSLFVGAGDKRVVGVVELVEAPLTDDMVAQLLVAVNIQYM